MGDPRVAVSYIVQSRSHEFHKYLRQRALQQYLAAFSR